MARMFIVVGDMTSSGGRVVSGSPFTDIDGKPVARVNDMAVCPKHKGSFPIVTGDTTLIIDGQPVARHGDSIACGCKVLAVQQSSVFIDQGGSGGSSGAGVAGVAVAAASTVAAAAKSEKSQQPVYDQAIRFVGASGAALAGVSYTLHLANGETHTGVTDDNGTTRRVETDSEQTIVKAELSPAGPTTMCCAKEAPESESAAVDLAGASTTSAEIGTSVHQITATGHERPLTAGEINMARLVFGDAVDYSKVKVHNHGYWLFFGMQDKDTAVTPNGDVLPGGRLQRRLLIKATNQPSMVHP